MSTDTPRGERADSFGRGVDAYRRARPSYPDDAVRWLLPGEACRVVDLAAGTGKLTERLHALGHDVTAVEPSDAMRAALQEALPGVPAVAGTAEAIPLPDSTMDAVVVAQAWHWFDARAAQREIARVLRPGARLGVVWNVREHRAGWVDAFSEIIHRGDSLEPSYGPLVLDDESFTDPEHATFPWTHRMPASDLRTLAASRSHLLTLPPAERDSLLDEVERLTRTHPELRGQEWVELPYRAECWRADLRRPADG